MNVLAFVLVAGVVAMYVILDGYDLGVASITPLIARNGKERAASMEAIGPFWNGNEVFLIAGGAMLFALFPRAYASSFSGFYLPFFVVLWLLMFRGIAIELRGHLASELWQNFWDACFTGSSALLMLIFGVAIGNLVRGLPLDEQGYFRGTFAFLLNPYALLVGIFAITALAYHGCSFLALRIRGGYATRAEAFAKRLWWPLASFFIVVTVATFMIRSLAVVSIVDVPGVVAAAALAAAQFIARTPLQRFIASSLFLLALLAAAASTMFPYLVPSIGDPARGLSIYSAAPSPPALLSAILATGIGLCIVAAYGLYLLPRMAGKVEARSLDEDAPATSPNQTVS